ncbi:MAG: C69 family dipeptidase [Candidatus Krumholzibacteriota bacterium]|nr:C69 family dipeptidase [Candidatus Krumholzibacteriota bacterium]
MNRISIFLFTGLILTSAAVTRPAGACTNFLITKGASADGSTMISYAADSHVLYGELYFTPARDHIPGSMLDIYEWDSGKHLGQIIQVPHTYSTVGLINEHQLSIGETTWGGRSELGDSTAIIDYGNLMFLALQRARTAREAIEVMGDLVARYGYYSSGESFSISDPNEVWFMDLIGKGPDNQGAVWVARRIPDGYISAHANQARIRQFPLKDKKNCLYAPDVIDFAREKGYFDGPDKEFSFADAYAPLDYGALRFCEARVYAMFNRAAPSLQLSMDYVKGVPGAEPMPLWIKPDRKLTVHDVMEFMRDHFEGTEFDLAKDIGAGPYSCPYRWRPLTWKVNDKEYVNERAASTQQTGFSFVTQARSWLPDPIGGIIWFGVDDTYSTVYNPVYCGITRVPHSYAVGTGDFHHFSWEAAFWVFNWVSNYAYSRYVEMIKDIRIAQQELEGKYLGEQSRIDETARVLFEQSPGLAVDYLTEYSCRTCDATVERWRKLGQDLLVRYMDGNLKDELGNVTHPGYPQSWYEEIVEETGDHFLYRKLEGEE